MRADRLLRILLLLQSRGRMTAGELAERLEVSVRTVQRDMEALGAAGVPVYALRGGDGGWELTKGFRTTLTGLTPSEALAVVVGRPAGLLSDLGIDGSSDAALLKVMAAIPELAREAAEHARQRVHVDLEPWGGRDESPPFLRELHEATSQDAVTRIRYGAARSSFAVHPLGLVAKGLVWYLVALRGDALRTYRVSRLLDVVVTEERFERPAGFDLASHWREVSAGLRRTFSSYVVRLRVRGAALSRLRWSAGRTTEVSPRDDDGWTVVEVDLESEHEALSVVLGLGDGVSVVTPRAFRTLAARTARAFAANNR